MTTKYKDMRYDEVAILDDMFRSLERNLVSTSDVMDFVDIRNTVKKIRELIDDHKWEEDVRTGVLCPKCGKDIIATEHGTPYGNRMVFRCSNGCCNKNGLQYILQVTIGNYLMLSDATDYKKYGGELFRDVILKDMEEKE